MDIIEQAKKIDLDLSHYEQWQMWGVGGAGLLLLFFGYKIKKIAFFIVWFLLGYIATGYLMPIINSAVVEIASSELWQSLLPIGGGLLLALMGFMIEKICLGGICFGLVVMMTAQYFGTEIQTMAIGAVVGVLAGGIAVMMIKPATIIATAVAGAYALTLSVLALAPNLDAEALFWPMIAGFSVLGVGTQFLICRHD